MGTIKSEELAAFDGNGRPAYVSYQGKVYDVSASRFWKGGQHARRHQAGRDLTAEMTAAPHGPDVLGRVPEVGELEKSPPAPGRVPGWLERLLERFPIFRRHPHPIAVHFPIALFNAAAGFLLLGLAAGKASFETTALHCLAAGILFTPPAMLSGFFTWWLNYEARPMRPVILKIILSAALLVVSLAALALRVTRGPGSLLQLILVLLLVPLTVSIGWLGGSLSFPYRRS